MMRILLIEAGVRHTGVADIFGATDRFIVERAADGSEALQLLRLYGFDVVVYATDLHEPTATEFIRRLRAAGDRTPAIGLGGDISGFERARLLDAGSDDVVTLPCDSLELAARLRAVVRRAGGYASSILSAGAVELQIDSRQARAHGQDLHLSPTEFRVLELLILRKGTLVSKAAMMDSLYGDLDEPEIKSIDVLMHRLRKRLAAAGVGALITTVWGAGYIVREIALPQPVAARPVAARRAENGAFVH
jgi:two-component system cell cycle response regulator CtrA